MEERLYNYLVIEEIKEGIHSIAEVVQWYQWDRENDHGWKEIETPKTGFCNHAIG